MPKRICALFRNLFRKESVEERLDEEIRASLDFLAQEKIEAGMDADEARRKAILELGGVEQIKEEVRDIRMGSILHSVLQDARYGIRLLWKNPGFTAAAMLTLALGIGAHTAIFSVVNGVLLKPLPYENPDELVVVAHSAPGIDVDRLTNSGGTYFTYREESRTFEDMGIWAGTQVPVTGLAEPEQVAAVVVSDGVFPLLRVQPVLGRRFLAADDSPGSPRTVILSYGYWQSRLGGDSAVIGRTLRIRGREWEIIGVMPRNFRFPNSEPSLFLPLRMDESRVVMGGGFGYKGIARLRPGVTLEDANQDVARMLPIAVERFGGATLAQIEKMGFGPNLYPLQEDVVGNIGRILWVLFGTASLVLLIALSNVANLFLVRAEARRREVALRTALGAPMGRLARQFLVESLLLGLLGGVAGLGLAKAGLQLLRHLAARDLPRMDDVTIDANVMILTVGVSLLAAILFALFPLFHSGRSHLMARLREAGQRSSGGKSRHRLRYFFAACQIALALVLSIGAGLMVRSFQALQAVHPGFERPEEVLTFRLTVPPARVPEGAEVARLHERILRRLGAIPGVTKAGSSTSIAMGAGNSYNALHVEDFPAPENQIPPVRPFKWVSGDYFAAMEIPVLAGRAITWADIHDRAPVAVVTERFARLYWGQPNRALGKRIGESSEGPWREIVGVVGNVHSAGLSQDPPELVYWPMVMSEFWGKPLHVRRSMAYAVRTRRSDPGRLLPEIREAVSSVDPDLPLAEVQTLDEILEGSTARSAFSLVMLGIAAATAVFLGTIGIYGVTSFVVAQRTHEFGVRIAIGASRGDVSRLVLRKGVQLATVGVGIGAAAAAGLTQLMAALLFGVSPTDPLTYLAAAIAVTVISLTASYIPARRATRVDPMVALRYE